MRKSFLVITITCVVAFAVSFAQQSEASQPAPQPAQTPTTTCPSNPDAPELVGPVRENTKVLTGRGPIPPAGCTATVAVYDVSNVSDQNGLTSRTSDPAATLLGVAAGTTVSATDGIFTLQLSMPVQEGQVIAIKESFGDTSTNFSRPLPVVVPGDWGRVRGYFTSGILVSQNQDSFSQSSMYLGFTLDKTWSMPGYYHRTPEKVSVLKIEPVGADKYRCHPAHGKSYDCDADGNPIVGAGHKNEKSGPRYRCRTPEGKIYDCDSKGNPIDVGKGGGEARVWRPRELKLNGGGPSAPDSLSDEPIDEAQDGAIQGASSPVAALKGKKPWWRPGINTYFDVRLTSVPVSACDSSGSSSGSNQVSPCTPAAGGATPTPTPAATPTPGATPTPTSLETFLSSRKTARFDVGIYFPFTWTTWTYNNATNSLFIAPLAKVGFDTPAGSLNQVQPASTTGSSGTTGNVATANTGTVTAVNPTSFYNFYAFGARIGHYKMSPSTNRAPELISYLDVAFGPFSNLESLVVPDNTPTAIPTRKRLYRIHLEGILKIPTTPLIVGFNANVGQEAVGTSGINIVQRAGDDLRFLFGAKFDVGKLLSHITGNAP